MKREREEEQEEEQQQGQEGGMIVFENGLRRITPYWFTFTVFVKGRMQGKTLLDAMSTEFNANKPEYYKRAIADGRIQVNSARVEETYVLRGHDLISHHLHRHEPPVRCGAHVEIVGRTNDYVAVYKPASVPVHPTGRYRRNSLIFLLEDEQGLPKLFPAHRLDRLTSGIIVFGTSSEAARRFSDLIQQEGAMQKEYVALVHGEFPANDTVEVNKPILVFGKHQGGVCTVDETGNNPEAKPALSEFRRLWFDAERNVSLVQCVPKTGRTHQLRVHLLSLGHPILDDPLYGPRVDPNKPIIDSLGNTREDYLTATGAVCQDCGEPTFADPDLYAIHLHARRYSSPHFDFSCPLPDWAIERKT